MLESFKKFVGKVMEGICHLLTTLNWDCKVIIANALTALRSSICLLAPPSVLVKLFYSACSTMVILSVSLLMSFLCQKLVAVHLHSISGEFNFFVLPNFHLLRCHKILGIDVHFCLFLPTPAVEGRSHPWSLSSTLPSRAGWKDWHITALSFNYPG